MSMICPETYYEMNLKGKNKEEILKEIHSLKREINRCIRRLEDPDYEGPIFCPGDDVIIKCDWEYLDKAKQAYAEAGGVYEPTRKELYAEEFNRALDNLFSLEFINGTVRSFNEPVRCIVHDNVVDITYDSSRTEKCAWKKGEFIQVLRDIHIGEWKHSYEFHSKKYGIMDENAWRLEFTFKSGHIKKFQGENAYPWNFNDFRELLVADY